LAFAARDDLGHPNSFIGNAGWSGGLELWIEIAEVPVANETTLPLRLRFASDVTRENSLLGEHWWCPLLESWGLGTPDYLEFTTLGGGRRILLKSNGWLSKDGQASGREVDGIVKIDSAQWHYQYANGKIAEAIAPDGTRLAWHYEAGNLSAIRRVDDGTELVKISRKDQTIKIHGAFGEFVFRTVVESKKPGKSWGLKFPDGREDHIEIVPDGVDVSEMRITSLGKPAQVFRWSSASGALLSDNDFTYEVRRTDTGEDLLHRVDKEGRTEWYTFDVPRGLATYKRQDGSRVQSWYHVEPGPRYMKCFRMDTLSKDQALVSSRLLTYEAGGNVSQDRIEMGTATLGATAGVRYISTEEAERLHGEPGTLFLDARTLEEYQHGHIPGALHLGRVNFETDFPAVESQLKTPTTLVVYCTSRQCEDSSIVAIRLRQLGFNSVLVFEGGWAEWWKRHR